MNDATHASTDLATKIARLVEERGWNQEEFARIANLNRQTVRQILVPSGDRRLRNATIAACARALNLTVNELRTLPLERLLPRMHGHHPANGDEQMRRLYEQATQPELLAWSERNLCAGGVGGLLRSRSASGTYPNRDGLRGRSLLPEGTLTADPAGQAGITGGLDRSHPCHSEARVGERVYARSL